MVLGEMFGEGRVTGTDRVKDALMITGRTQPLVRCWPVGISSSVTPMPGTHRISTNRFRWGLPEAAHLVVDRGGIDPVGSTSRCGAVPALGAGLAVGG
jgi:hypothetical protein